MKIRASVFDAMHAIIQAMRVHAAVRNTHLDRHVQEDVIEIDPSPPEFPVLAEPQPDMVERVSGLHLGVMFSFRTPNRIVRQLHLTLDRQLQFNVSFYAFPHWNRTEIANADGRLAHLYSFSEINQWRDYSMLRYPIPVDYDRDQALQAYSCLAQEIYLWLIEHKLPDFEGHLSRAGHTYTNVARRSEG